jgi:hypothetical protein
MMRLDDQPKSSPPSELRMDVVGDAGSSLMNAQLLSQIEALGARVGELEGVQRVRYVHSRVEFETRPPPRRLVPSLTAMLNEMSEQLAEDDELGVATTLSRVRGTIRELRGEFKDNHRLLLGTIFDALTFTPQGMLSPSRLLVIQDALTTMLNSTISDTEYGDAADAIEAAGWLTFPDADADA